MQTYIESSIYNQIKGTFNLLQINLRSRSLGPTNTAGRSGRSAGTMEKK